MHMKVRVRKFVLGHISSYNIVREMSKNEQLKIHQGSN